MKEKFLPRPRQCRLVQENPRVNYFKPRGVPLRELTEAYLAVEGYEALRLADMEGLTMEEAASRMEVSRHTFGRILANARRAVADALVNGRALHIQGGHYEVLGNDSLKSSQCGPGLDTGQTSNSEDRGARSPLEMDMTKVAVTSDGPTLDSNVDPRFGRAGGFVVVDVETMESEYVDNGESQAMAHGAGIQAAQRVADAGASVVLTGYVGPKAFQALQGAGLRIGQNLDNMTVRQAVDRFKTGEVEFADQPNK